MPRGPNRAPLRTGATIYVRCPPELKARLEKIFPDVRSVSSKVVMLIERALGAEAKNTNNETEKKK